MLWRLVGVEPNLTKTNGCISTFSLLISFFMVITSMESSIGWEKKRIKKMSISYMLLEARPCSRVGTLYQFNGPFMQLFYLTCQQRLFKWIVWRMFDKDSWIREFVINDIPNDWSSLKLVKMGRYCVWSI